MKSALLIALLLPAGCLFGQRTEVPGNAAPPLLQRPYEAARDFFNFYAFANSTFDTNGSYLNSGGGATRVRLRVSCLAAALPDIMSGPLEFWSSAIVENIAPIRRNRRPAGTTRTSRLFSGRISAGVGI